MRTLVAYIARVDDRTLVFDPQDLRPVYKSSVRDWKREEVGIGVQRCPMTTCDYRMGVRGPIERPNCGRPKP